MTGPNIFHFPMSGSISGDFVLAYILRWADPKYQNVCPETHKLGDDLLRMILGKAEDPKNKIKTEHIRNIEEVWAYVTEGKRGTEDRVIVEHDVEAQVMLYDSSFPFDRILILTGKKYRYRPNDAISGRRVSAAYWKGDEEIPVFLGYGFFYRKDLLAVLDNHPYTGNNFIEEYRDYLRTWAEDVVIRPRLG